MPRRGTNSGIQKGGIHDPVAQSIRAEQNRDAMPSPDEAKRKHRKHLSNTGCHICGEDDPDKLTQEMPFHHKCRDLQHPDPEPRVVCKDGHPSVRERKLQELQEKANEEGVPYVVYECDAIRAADPPEKNPHRHMRGDGPEPTVKLRCGGQRCKSEIDEIIYPDEEDN